MVPKIYFFIVWVWCGLVWSVRVWYGLEKKQEVKRRKEIGNNFKKQTKREKTVRNAEKNKRKRKKKTCKKQEEAERNWRK